MWRGQRLLHVLRVQKGFGGGELVTLRTRRIMSLWLLVVIQIASASALARSFTGATAQLAPPCTRKLNFASMMCTASSGDDEGGGSGGSGGGGRDDESAGDDDDDDANARDETSALATGANPDNLPADLLEALESGRIGSSEIANWKAAVANPLMRALALSSYARARLLADPRLPTVIAVECFVGCAATLAAEKSARGDRFRYELDFVLANQMLVLLTNLALVLALAPAATLATPAAAGSLGALGASLPAFALQVGEFTTLQRAASFSSRAVHFSFIGCATSLVGQASTLGLLRVRSHLREEPMPVVDMAPALPTAAAYGSFMALSASSRYQLVSAMEALSLKGGRTLTSCVARTFNNYIGSSNWMWWIEHRGLA